MVLDKTPTGPLELIPPAAAELLLGIKQNTRQPITLITSQGCAPGDECLVESVEYPKG